MRLIIGLGNPGEKYKNTRHNVGFMVVEKIAQKEGIVFRQENTHHARMADFGDLQNRIKLIEPLTFMNESGRSIGKIKNYWKVDSEDIWVIHDDVDLEFGQVRINLSGSSAGHKGVQSIIENIGDQFWRIRIGVGKSDKIPTEEWVLQNFDDAKAVNKIVDKVAEDVLEFLRNKIEEITIKIN